MDLFITIAIVAVAVVWVGARIVRRFNAKAAPSCESCAGCSVGAQTSNRKPCNPAGVLVVVLLALAVHSSASAQPSEEPEPGKVAAFVEGLDFSGFFDVQAANRRNDPDVVSLGDFELDLASDLGKNAQLGAAVVMNEEEASLAVAFVDLHFFGGLIAPRGRLPIEKGFHVQIGKFDVPFGQDWRFFASKDRTELSAPLTTDVVMDGGLNDTGIRILGSNPSVNYSAFVLKGEGPGNLYGGRLGITPFDSPYQLKPHVHVFEVGISMLRDADGDNAPRSDSVAFDTEAQLGRCHLRAEHVRKDTRAADSESERTVLRGWHVTAAFDAGEVAGTPLVPYARYDTVSESMHVPADHDHGFERARTQRITAGLNATLFSVLMLKVEYQRALAAPFEVRTAEGFGRTSWFAQAVFVF